MMTPEQIAAITRNPDLVAAMEEFSHRPLLDMADMPWVRAIRIRTTWDRPSGESIKVDVIVDRVGSDRFGWRCDVCDTADPDSNDGDDPGIDIAGAWFSTPIDAYQHAQQTIGAWLDTR